MTSGQSYPEESRFLGRPIRIVIGDDHSMLRAVIRKTLDLHDQCVVVGEASDNDEVIACCRQILPDVLLLDASMGGTSTREVILALRSSIPRMRIVILSAEDAPTNLSDLINAGIAGYIVKGDPTSDLYSAIFAVALGAKWYSRTIIRRYRAILNLNADRRP